MSKKSKVTSISLDTDRMAAVAAVNYTLGTTPKTETGEDVPGLGAVTEIKRLKDRFGGGHIMDCPGYAIYTEGSPAARLIRDDLVTTIDVAVVENEEAAYPALED